MKRIRINWDMVGVIAVFFLIGCVGLFVVGSCGLVWFYFKTYTVEGTIIDKYVQPPTSDFWSSTPLRKITMIDIDGYGVYMVDNDNVYYGTDIFDRIEMNLKIIKGYNGKWRLETVKLLMGKNFLSWKKLRTGG